MFTMYFFQEPSQVEVVFLSEKTGNADEVNINKERRQALQMEIDQASQPQKPAKPSACYFHSYSK